MDTAYRRYARPVIAALSIAVVIGTARTVPSSWIVRLFHDDSFFYLVTARNLAAGLGSTFDGINTTNGYHPLYLLVLATFSTVQPLFGAEGIWAVFTLDSVLSAAALALMFKLMRDRTICWLPRTVVLIGLLGPVAFRDFGMEVKLLLPLAWLLVVMTSQLDAGATWLRFLRVGLVAALVTLTRLDALLLPALLVLHVVFSGRLGRKASSWRHRAAVAGLMLGPAVVTATLYCAFNAWTYGRVVTVSAWLRTDWMAAGFWSKGLGYSFYTKVCLAVCLSCAAVYIVARLIAMRRYTAEAEDSRGALSGLLLALAWFNLLYLVVLHAFYRYGVPIWCCALPLSISAILAADVVDRWACRIRLPTLSVATQRSLIGVALLFASGVFISFTTWCLLTNNRDDNIAFGRWIKGNLPANARVYQVDAAGIVSYYAERPIINGDGLINGWEYQAFLRSGQLPAYLANRRVEFIASDETRNNGELTVFVRTWKTPGQLLRFSEAPRQIVRIGRFVLLHPIPGTAFIEHLR